MYEYAIEYPDETAEIHSVGDGSTDQYEISEFLAKHKHRTFPVGTQLVKRRLNQKGQVVEHIATLHTV